MQEIKGIYLIDCTECGKKGTAKTNGEKLHPVNCCPNCSTFGSLKSKYIEI